MGVQRRSADPGRWESPGAFSASGSAVASDQVAVVVAVVHGDVAAARNAVLGVHAVLVVVARSAVDDLGPEPGLGPVALDPDAGVAVAGGVGAVDDDSGRAVQVKPD